MNKLDLLFQSGKQNLLSIYYTAGYPQLDDTLPVLKALETGGVDMVEIGMPFSDPLADGPVIQQSSLMAIHNGMTLKRLLAQLKSADRPTIPLILMGYLNPVQQYGFESFCRDASDAGVDGFILPDMPLIEFDRTYKAILDRYHLRMIFLITPLTPDERIREIDNRSSGFIYAVSTSMTTGTRDADFSKTAYFERLKNLQLKNPIMVGFGIKDQDTFTQACQYARGGIIGTAFIHHLSKHGRSDNAIHDFIKSVKPL